MSEYYTVPRTRGLYNTGSKEPFKLSRSKIDLSLECPRCFYLDRKCGVGRPPGFPFNLNSAVDTLLKTEFDAHRVSGTQHPLQEHYGIDAVPAKHKDLDTWRHNFTGVEVFHAETNFVVFGAIDDLWQNSNHEYIVVDYKATAKAGTIESLDQAWHSGYKRQMEIYQWLLRQKGYEVSNTGYFVYCNGRADREAFDARLEFDVTLIPYTGSDTWVEETLHRAKKILDTNKLPDAAHECDYCRFFTARSDVEQNTTFS
jgi:PD-(D/E)XK nuclease superfamily